MRVALYTRVSSEKQGTDLSISAQLKALIDYAKKNSHSVIREFVDRAETGRNTERPAFRKMISLARQRHKPFDMILVWKYSRFARSRKDSVIYKALLRKNGVQVVSITEPFDDTPTGRLLEAIIESLDEFYSDNLGEEVTRGMRESASRGFYLSGRPPYGFHKIKVKDGKRERTKLKIDPYQANIVTAIFNNALNGKDPGEIAQELNRKGITGPLGKGWGKTSIYYILTNEVYAGTLVWGRNSKRGLEPVRIKNAFLAIVDQVTFDKVQDQLARKKPKRHYTKKTAKLAVNNAEESIPTFGNIGQQVHSIDREIGTPFISCRDKLVSISNELTDIKHRLAYLCTFVEKYKENPENPVNRIDERRYFQGKCPIKKNQIGSPLPDAGAETASPEMGMLRADDLDNSMARGPVFNGRACIQGFIRDVRVTGREVLVTYTIPLSSARTSGENAGVLSN